MPALGDPAGPVVHETLPECGPVSWVMNTGHAHGLGDSCTVSLVSSDSWKRDNKHQLTQLTFLAKLTQ